jgi:thioredoxin-like negative regulator of GroEL
LSWRSNGKPALVAAHLGLGNALAVMGRNEEALERYKQTLRCGRGCRRRSLPRALCWPGWDG